MSTLKQRSLGLCQVQAVPRTLKCVLGLFAPARARSNTQSLGTCCMTSEAGIRVSTCYGRHFWSVHKVSGWMTEKAEAAWTRGLGLAQSNFARTGWEQDSWAKTTLRAKEFLSRKRFFKSPVRLSWLHFTQAKNQQASSIIKVFRLLPGQRANGQTHPRIHFLIWKLSECLQPLAIHEFHEFLWLSISKMSKKTCDHQESSSKHFEHHAVCQQFFC